MIIRVLIINRQLVFAVTIKQALEQTGAFEVHPFTDPNAAMEYLRTHPHDVALIDFDIRILPGAEIVRQLREIQPEIAIIASPMQPDSSRMIRDLELQGMIDAPFSARGIIPLIEHAVEQMAQPGRAITRSFVEPDQPGTDTEILGRPDPSEPRPRPPIQRTEPAHTRILSDEDNSPPARIPPEADDEPENLPNTRMLPGDEPAQTRILQEDSSPDDLPQTRILPGVEEDDLPPVPPSTRILPGHTDRPAAPPRLPEFSSLDDILADEAPSSLFEPPVRDGDTPAVPSVDSDAVRQFLATSSDQGDRTFDSMLSEISPDESADGPPQLPGGDFQDLVNSMRAEQAHTPLPDRHQQFVEFILTGGMDNLLSEIEKAKTGPLEDEEGEIPEPPPAPKLRKLSPPPKSQPPATTFEKLAADEPPMPALEEGGTVSDLMVGVSDTSFRNVLAMMRGEEADDEGTSAQPPASVSRAEIEAAYAAFFDQTTEQETELEPEDTPPSLPEPEPDESSITAQLILETALDESTPVDSFSLNHLIDDIERQLVEHKPDIQPLPSWNMESFQSRQLRKLESKPPEKPESRRDRTERFVQEPDFLPEEFSDPAGPRPTEEMAPEAMWEIKQRMDDAKSALDQAFEAEEAVDFDETVPSRSAWEPQAAQEPEWLADAEVDEDTDSGPGVPTLEPPMEPEWLLDELPFDDETVLGSGRETTLTEPPSMPEELFFDEDEDVQAAPASAWEEAEDATWDAEPEWDLESESAAAHQEVPPSLPGFEDDWELTIDEASDEHTVMLERPYPAELPVTLGAAADFEPQASEFDLAERDDPYIAQIALSLTQVSLELAAEATLLTSNEEIVAFAGQLTQDEVEELRAAVADDWTANPNEARVRFITLASSGKDYMLYSRKTVNDFTLTMIFSGTTPLRDIRRQGRRLIEALESVPEDVLQEEAETLPELATMTGEMPAVESVRAEPEVVQPFTYLWVLREPDQGFSEHAGRAIAAGLNLQLGEMGWQVKSLRAQGEYVYVHADVPGEQPAYAVIDDLKRRAGEIAQAQEPDLRSESLWADSYLVMMPGRELEPDEIDQFITFDRMA